MIEQCKKNDFEDRLRHLKLPTLKFRRIRGDLIEAFKMLTGVYDAEACPVFKMHKDRETRGHSLKLLKDRVMTKDRRNFFTERIVDVWNSLPLDIVEANSVNSFKNKLDKHFSSQDLYYNYKSDLAGAGNRSCK